MKVTHKFRRLDNNRERGVTMVLVAAAMVAIVGMAAMSIDLVTLYLAREEAQRTADTAALAAARIISVSGITGTANPAGDPTDWSSICSAAGGWATQAAQAVAAQNTIGGQSLPVVAVTYSDGTTSSADCTVLSEVFAVNPMVTVQITPSVTIPSFFSRIWGSTGNQISATATAEAFNPSQSDKRSVGAGGSVTPVQPHCVKPWIVPNQDPGNPYKCTPSTCKHFVDPSDGAIQNPGISPDGTGKTGVIGEWFTLFADCSTAGAPCAPTPINSPPTANVTTGIFEGTQSAPPLPNLEYLPAADPVTSVGFLSSCTGASKYQQAVAGCDQTTAYQCGVQVSAGGTNTIDLNENPGGPAGDTPTGLACSLTHTDTIQPSGQDTLGNGGTNPYPFVALAGDVTSKLMGVPDNTPLTSSNSIVSLPIYDGSALSLNNKAAPVTIVGFLQVFVRSINPNDGSVNVTVLNVAGCGNGATNPPVFGSSPVPVRLITPPLPPQ